MNYNEILIKYIDNYPTDEPIFIEDIKRHFESVMEEELLNNIIKDIYVYINRLVKANKVEQCTKGVYYKETKNKEKSREIVSQKTINRKYIKDANGQKGYYTGIHLFNELGLTSQTSPKIIIVANECPNNNHYKNKGLGVTIKRPKIIIDNDNCRYLKLFDVLINRDNVEIEVSKKREKEIIYKYIKDNKIEMERLFEYANKLYNLKPIEKLYDISGEE